LISLTRVDQLPYLLRVPPQVGSAWYCTTVQVWAMYSFAVQIDPVLGSKAVAA